MEVYLVMQKAPISWGPILNLETVRSTSLLYLRATDHELTLVHVAKYESTNIITSDNLLYSLRKLGIHTDRNRPFERSAKLVMSKDTKSEPGGEVIHEAFLGQLSREEYMHEISSNQEVMKEALQVLKKCQRPRQKEVIHTVKMTTSPLKWDNYPLHLAKFAAARITGIRSAQIIPSTKLNNKSQPTELKWTKMMI